MLILRQITFLNLRSLIYVSPPVLRYYSKAYSSDEDKKSKTTEPKNDGGSEEEVKESAALRLNRILACMETEDSTLTKQSSFPSARPGEGMRKRKDATNREPNTKDVLEAAKRVASLLSQGNDASKKQTESELLSKLLSKKIGISNGPAKTDTANDKVEINFRQNSRDADMSLSDLIVGMKIDRRQQTKEHTRADFVRRTLSQHQQGGGESLMKFQPQSTTRGSRKAELYTGTVNLFRGETLGIFNQTQMKSSEVCVDLISTWRHFEQGELKLNSTHPPGNYYEKLALWTIQGKLWHFPINNEQYWNEETTVDFTEHIFFEQHLDSWCPSRGPVRHFMELVCVGLSKNPYLTAQEKREHILWYREYFASKKEILTDLMQNDDLSDSQEKHLAA